MADDVTEGLWTPRFEGDQDQEYYVQAGWWSRSGMAGTVAFQLEASRGIDQNIDLVIEGLPWEIDSPCASAVYFDGLKSEWLSLIARPLDRVIYIHGVRRAGHQGLEKLSATEIVPDSHIEGTLTYRCLK